MEKLLVSICIFISFSIHSQQLFKVYTDSTHLVNEANIVVKDFVKKVNAVKPVFSSEPVAILNTRPYLIFYSPKANQVNLPIWHQVMQQQKKFFIELAGSEAQGMRFFGLFFNGFYLPHELGHALQSAAKKKAIDQYQNEYTTNQIAMLYWRKVKRKKELKQCYQLAKKVVNTLNNPVPEGEDPIRYFNENYAQIGADPYKYGYFQFRQFVTIYEDKKLKKFDDFIKHFLGG